MAIEPIGLLTSTREFWRHINRPSEALLGKTILAILVLAETLASFFWIYSLSGLGDGYAVMAAVPYVYLVISYISLLFFYRTQRFEYAIFTQLVMLLVMPFFMQWALGGYEVSSGIAIWAILSPIGALMILGTKQSTPWFILFAALALISWKMNDIFAGHQLPIPVHVKDAFFLMNVLGTACILYAAMRYFQSQKERTYQELQLEQVRSEKLLLNILPAPIAARLKENDMRIADYHDAVSILFADLVNFTQLSAQMPPQQLVDVLNTVFSSFDAITERHGLEKIKTIGDAYMAVSGAPNARVDHAQALAMLAIEMQQVLADIAAAQQIDLKMRIGIHSGPVVAGVIGSKKFSYDLWGDTVNFAARLEETAELGTIHVSEATYALLQSDYRFAPRMQVDLKGKGQVVSYTLLLPT